MQKYLIFSLLGVCVLCYVNSPDFYPTQSGWQNSVNISLTSDTGATIYYTLDGTDPIIPLSLLFENVIYIDTPGTYLVKAIAHILQDNSSISEMTYDVIGCNPKCIHGVCSFLDADPKCECEKNWDGEDCNDSLAVNPFDWVLASTLITAGVIVIALLIILILWRQKSNRSKRIKKRAAELEEKLDKKEERRRGKSAVVEMRNPGKKLHHPIARIKAPHFLYEMNYNSIILGRVNNEEFVDLDMSEVEGIDAIHLSRIHCLIFNAEEKGCFILENFGRHGTIVDGVTLAQDQKHKLHDRSVIEICGARLVFRDDIHGEGDRPRKLSVNPAPRKHSHVHKHHHHQEPVRHEEPLLPVFTGEQQAPQPDPYAPPYQEPVPYQPHANVQPMADLGPSAPPTDPYADMPPPYEAPQN